MNIEVEFGANFTKEKHDELFDFLMKNGTDLGEDNKDNWFFVFPDKNLKVVNNISKKSAKAVLKLGKVGVTRSQEEIEVFIKPEDIEKMVRIFTELGHSEVIHTFTQRHNFSYRGVEIALKYSEDWDWHLEMEVMIDDPKQEAQAEEKIREVAKELGVALLTKEELRQIAHQIESKYREKSINKNSNHARN